LVNSRIFTELGGGQKLSMIVLMKTILHLFLMLVACQCFAQELPKFDVLRVGQKTFKGVTVTTQEPSGIRFTHEAGAGRAKWDELEPDVRAKFTFDPVAAKKFEEEKHIERMNQIAADIDAKKAAKQGKAKSEALAKMEWRQMTIKISSAVPGGYLCYEHQRGGPVGSVARAMAEITGGPTYVNPRTNYSKIFFVSGIKGEVAVDQIVDCTAVKVGVKNVYGQPYEHWTSQP
jgi:hypothetical protein